MSRLIAVANFPRWGEGERAGEPFGVGYGLKLSSNEVAVGLFKAASKREIIF